MLQVPNVTGPIPVTTTSHPFLSARAAMEAVGYVEEEYFLSGQANVYDWVGDTRDIKVVAGPGQYVTRILVRRPRDPARFSGNVEMTVLNASMGIDLGGPIELRRMLEQGDAWVGITTKAIAAKALKRFDPTRYAPLDWSSPVPVAQRCPVPSIIPAYMIGDTKNDLMPPGSAPETEDGLVWDMLGQLGLLLKSEERQKILPGFGKPWVYMDGLSQSSIYIRTWVAGFHDRYRTPDGQPVYDGYLAVVGAAMVGINQCSTLPMSDPRQKLAPPPDVPFISLSSEGEMWQAAHTHQPDSVTSKGGIVSYQVAGASHGAGEVPGLPSGSYTISPETLAQAGFDMVGAMGAPNPGFMLNDFIWEPLVRGAYHNLQLWVRHGIIPPQAPGIEVDAAGTIKRDHDGNALGGVRLPYIDVPVASHAGFLAAGGMGGVAGSKTPFPPEKLKALYPDHATYMARFAAATDKMLDGRWISVEDAAAMKRAAEAVPV